MRAGGTLGASSGVRLALEQYPAGPIFRAMAPWTPRTKRQTLIAPPSQHSEGLELCDSNRRSAADLRASGQRRSMPHRLDMVASGSTVASISAQLQAPAVLPCVHWDNIGDHAVQSFSNQFPSSTWPPSQVPLSCPTLDGSD